MIEHKGHGGFILGDTAMEEYEPWLRPSSARYIESVLPKGAFVFEWGMGASTVWMAKLGCHVISLELDHDWFLAIEEILEKEKLDASIYCFGMSNDYDKYADYILKYDDNLFDLVLIDGRNRCRCLANARSKVKVGGMLCLDNSEREEYQKAVALLDTWNGYTWGDFGWETTVWTRPDGTIKPVTFESEDA